MKTTQNTQKKPKNTQKLPMKTKLKDLKIGVGTNRYLGDKQNLLSLIKRISEFQHFDMNHIPLPLRYDREVVLKMIEQGVLLGKDFLAHFEQDQEVMQANQALNDLWISKKKEEEEQERIKWEKKQEEDEKQDLEWEKEFPEIAEQRRQFEENAKNDKFKSYRIFSELPLELQQDEEKFEAAKFELLVDLIEGKLKIQDLKYSRFNDDKDVAFIAICQYYDYFFYFSDAIKEDELLFSKFKEGIYNLYSSIFDANEESYEALFHQVKKSLDDIELMTSLMNVNDQRFDWASDRLKSDPEFVLFALKKNWRIISQVKLNVDEHEEIYQVLKSQLSLIFKGQSSDTFSFDDPVDQACITPRMYKDEDLARYLKHP
jgi:hypothetical protein